MAQKLAIVLAISTLLSGVHSDLSVKQNHKEVTVKEGDEVQLTCSSDVEALGCTFTTPSGVPYLMLKGASYENGRIVQTDLDPKDCAIKITDIQEVDNGEWKCTITGKGQSGNFEIGNGLVQVVVAIPPSDVHLEVDGQQVTGPIQLNLDQEKQVLVDCVASGSRPGPEFQWFIGNTLLNANIKTREMEDESGRMTYVSSLEYNAAPKHSGQMLKCVVTHIGYTMMALEDKQNQAEAELNLQFKPDEKATTETFYDMKEGETNNIKFKFRANPKPSSGVWKIGETSVPIGASSVDQKFESSQIANGDLPGEYVVDLTFTMEPELASKNYALEVTNELGTTTYGFNLALSGKPPVESANGPVIGIIIFIVIIILVGGITVIARAKGALCFAAKKKKEEDTEQAVDKEGSDTESAEDTTAAATPANGKDETDNKDDGNENSGGEKKDEHKKPGMVSRVTNLFAAMKKSVVKPKDGSKYSPETPESEMKLNDNEEKKDGETDNVVYADLDKSALGSGTRRESVENEKTEYAEIRPQN